MPVFIATDIFFLVIRITKRNLSFKVIKVKSLEDIEDNIHNFQEFFLNLLRRTEDVGIILRKTAYPGQSVKFTTLLVTVNSTELGKSHRQFTIRTRECLEDFTVVRTVHRFKQIFFTFFRGMDWLERIFAVFSIVT